MTYIIAEPCIDIKDRSCVDVCPVDCIHEFERILIIDPEECIDCGACEPECPVEAIFPEDALPEKWEPFVKINYAYPDADPINSLVDEYARETTSTTCRSKHASRRRLLRRECSRRELDRRKRTGYSRRRPATREKTDDAFLTVRKLQARELRGLVQGLGARRMAGRRAKGVHPAQPVSRLERRLP
jgi:ferredoxin